MIRSVASRFVVLSLAVCTCVGQSQSTPNIDASKNQGDRNVIVILRDQMPTMQPLRGIRHARASALAAAQTSLIGTLQTKRARNVRAFRTINAFATSVTPAEAIDLQNDPQVQAVVSDRVIRLPQVQRDLTSPASTNASSALPSGPQTPQCNTLEPEALQLTHTAFLNPEIPQAQTVLDGHGNRVLGTGVKVAFVADGLDINIPGFIRPDGSHVFIDYKDFSGDPAGTPTPGGEAFGDASSIAAQDHNGSLVYDISQFNNPAHPITSPCNIRIRGVAPGASLVGLKVFSSLGYTTTSAFVQAIEYAVLDDDVDVINESFGGNPFFDSANDPISLANTLAIQAGITVVVSTGDAGTAGTLGSPSTDPSVIAAGASTSFRAYAQTSDGVQPLAKGYLSNNISSLSSGGFAQRTPRTVDIVAPGDLGWALCSANITLYTECTNYKFVGSPIQVFGGTSQSSPLTAGEAALIIQAYRSTHNGATPTPALVKQIIMSTATDLGAPSDEQGAGLIDALAAVNTALSLDDQNGRPKHRGDGLFISQNSAELTDSPNSSEFLTFTVSNTGATTRHLTPRLEDLAKPSAGASLTVPLSPSTDPRFTFVNGALRAYATQTFTVPPGAEHLDAAIAFVPLNSQTYVNLGLLDPTGKQAAFSLPQGTGNGYGHVDVVKPAAGTWTAIIFTRVSGVTSYAGPVKFTWSTEQFAAIGSVFPSELDLAPGQSREILALFNMPSQPGDSAAAIRFHSAEQGPVIGDPEIPVTLRTLIPVGAHGSTFTAPLTGGNGRAGAGPTQTFEFDVPRSAKNLSLGLNVSDPGYALEGFLVDPHGMQLSIAVNADPITGAPLKTLQMYHENPEAGRWHFVLLQNFTSSGNQTSLPFTAHIGLNTIPYSAAALPDDAQVKVSVKGAALSVPITVVNNSAVPQILFADARLQAHSLSSLPIYTCSKTTTLPGLCLYTFLPTEVNDAQFEAQSTVPINMDASNSNGTGPVGFTGSPDLYAKTIGPNTVAASLQTREVPWSYWYLTPALIGPFGPAGAPTAPVKAAVFVNMRPFDPAVSADSGDLYLDAVYGSATFNPLVLAPGATGVINLRIKPTASQVGETVRGFVFLDNYSQSLGSGDEVVRIPYSYTVTP